MNILLVEDSRSDATLVIDFIAEEENAPQMHWVKDGHEALDYLYKRGKHLDAVRPDMILLDLALPRVGGYELLKELKESAFADIPVVVLTTSDNLIDCKNCLTLGAVNFYSKPYSLQGYEELVQELMASRYYKEREASSVN